MRFQSHADRARLRFSGRLSRRGGVFTLFLVLAIGAQPLAACGGLMSDQAPGKNASLRLAEPAELAGEWRITGGAAGPCAIRLEAARVEAANAHALRDPGGCLEALVGKTVVGWRPVPDGIELAGPDRLALMLFAFAGDAAVASAPGGRVLTLRRAG